MKKKDSIPQAKHQIKAIEIIESNLNALQSPLKENETFKFDISLEHRINNEKKVVVVVCTVSIYSENKDKHYGHLKAGYIFQVENFNEFIDTETKELKFPTDFLTALNSITISSTRGLLFSFFRGTYLHNAILPIIDLQSFEISKK